MERLPVILRPGIRQHTCQTGLSLAATLNRTECSFLTLDDWENYASMLSQLSDPAREQGNSFCFAGAKRELFEHLFAHLLIN